MTALSVPVPVPASSSSSSMCCCYCFGPEEALKSPIIRAHSSSSKRRLAGALIFAAGLRTRRLLFGSPQFLLRLRLPSIASAASQEDPQHSRPPTMLLTADLDDGPTVDTPNTSLLSSPPATLAVPKVLTLPTILTLGRVAAIPVLLFVFYSNKWWATTAVASIFVLAAITDWLDGFLARKMGSNSSFGAFLDPVADKLMVATTLVLLSSKPIWATTLPWLIPLPSIAIIGREITMSAVREWAASQGGNLQAAVAVNRLGKWKTASQMVALTILLAVRNESHVMAGPLGVVGVAMLYVSAGLALWSLGVYMKAIWGALVK